MSPQTREPVWLQSFRNKWSYEGGHDKVRGVLLLQSYGGHLPAFREKREEPEKFEWILENAVFVLQVVRSSRELQGGGLGEVRSQPPRLPRAQGPVQPVRVLQPPGGQVCAHPARPGRHQEAVPLLRLVQPQERGGLQGRERHGAGLSPNQGAGAGAAEKLQFERIKKKISYVNKQSHSNS